MQRLPRLFLYVLPIGYIEFDQLDQKQVCEMFSTILSPIDYLKEEKRKIIR